VSDRTCESRRPRAHPPGARRRGGGDPPPARALAVAQADERVPRVGPRPGRSRLAVRPRNRRSRGDRRRHRRLGGPPDRARRSAGAERGRRRGAPGVAPRAAGRRPDRPAPVPRPAVHADPRRAGAPPPGLRAGRPAGARDGGVRALLHRRVRLRLDERPGRRGGAGETRRAGAHAERPRRGRAPLV
ncbi:MAG: hypothetical protein AVDCRST_MAG30-1547, partial [uncultured Solirubrobacteraceae bacterium]